MWFKSQTHTLISHTEAPLLLSVDFRREYLHLAMIWHCHGAKGGSKHHYPSPSGPNTRWEQSGLLYASKIGQSGSQEPLSDLSLNHEHTYYGLCTNPCDNWNGPTGLQDNKNNENDGLCCLQSLISTLNCRTTHPVPRKDPTAFVHTRATIEIAS